MSSSDPARLRVLVSSFASCPGRGSEPGVGWNFAREMAKHHDVTVLTYNGFRQRIEAELAERPIPGLSFAFYAHSLERKAHAVDGVERHGIAEQLHYVMWQKGAASVARRLHAEHSFHLAHHVTLVKFWAPSALASLDIPFVWGPVGGGESAPDAFYPAFSPQGRRYERQRDVARRVMERTPGVRRTARSADLIFATTEETRQRILALGPKADVEVRSAIGLAREEIDDLATLPLPDDGPVRFLTIGRHIAFKGYRFALLAYAQALGDALAVGDRSLDGSELWMLGDGPDRGRLEALAGDLGLTDRVRFLGNVPRAEVLEHLANAHALVHPSLHESGGGACLEAMAAGRPVVGFELGGTAVHVPMGSGILVPALDPEQAVGTLAMALRDVAGNPERRRDMGREGRRVVAEEFGYEDRVADVAARYRALVGVASPAAPNPAPRLLAAA